MNQGTIYISQDSITGFLFDGILEAGNKDLEKRFAPYLNEYDDYNNGDNSETEDNSNNEGMNNQFDNQNMI